MTQNSSSTKFKRSRISSWAQWFDRCAQYFQDPRMKMAYYQDGKPVAMSVMRAMHKDVWNKMRAPKDSIVLDVGGGIGLFSQSFQHRVKRIIGTDISLTMVRDAYRLNSRGVFLLCEAASLPFSSRSFDRVLCYSVFHYLRNLKHTEEVLDEFLRVLKRDGLAFIGDILYPQNLLNRKKATVLPQRRYKNTAMWWPSSLNHDLKKLAFNPEFFINYCRKNNYQCKILAQHIPGKVTAESRYDVVIKF